MSLRSRDYDATRASPPFPAYGPGELNDVTLPVCASTENVPPCWYPFPFGAAT